MVKDKKQEQYKNTMRILDQEAKYTLILALIISIIFWLVFFIFHQSTISIAYFPLWFILSCIGCYFLSILGVYLLIKFKFKSIKLN